MSIHVDRAQVALGDLAVLVNFLSVLTSQSKRCLRVHVTNEDHMNDGINSPICKSKVHMSHSLEHRNALEVSAKYLKLLPWPHRPPALLLRLTPIRPPALNLFIPAQARTQTDVNSWWSREAETLSYLHQVEFVHIKDRA